MNGINSSSHHTRLVATFQDSLGKPAPECLPILDFIGAKNNGGGDGNWSCNKPCKAPVKSSPTNQHPVSYKSDALPVAQPTVSKH